MDNIHGIGTGSVSTYSPFRLYLIMEAVRIFENI